MEVKWTRETKSGERRITIVANDTALRPETIERWIEMLRAAQRWLIEGLKSSPRAE